MGLEEVGASCGVCGEELVPVEPGYLSCDNDDCRIVMLPVEHEMVVR